MLPISISCAPMNARSISGSNDKSLMQSLRFASGSFDRNPYGIFDIRHTAVDICFTFDMHCGAQGGFISISSLRSKHIEFPVRKYIDFAKRKYRQKGSLLSVLQRALCMLYFSRMTAPLWALTFALMKAAASVGVSLTCSPVFMFLTLHIPSAISSSPRSTA